MILTDEIKVLHDKSRANQGQYDLSREAAKISALSSKNLDRYDYLTREDLGYMPKIVEKAKFEYFTLGMVLTKSKPNKKKWIIKTNKAKIWFIFHSIVLQSLKTSMIIKNCHLLVCIQHCINLSENLIS